MATQATFTHAYQLRPEAQGYSIYLTVPTSYTLSSYNDESATGVAVDDGIEFSHNGYPMGVLNYVGNYNGGVVAFSANTNAYLLFLNDSSLQIGTIIVPDPSPFTWCYMEGTLIRTPAGEVPVEALRIGDAVLGADGRAHRVLWLGRQAVAPLFADPLAALPIQIAAGALGTNLPARDLRLSPSHAVQLGDLLVEAAALVNGTTIRRLTAAELPERFTYFHVETEGHELVLAEGLAAETFIDNVSRRSFDNWGEYVALYGDEEQPMSAADLDLPRVKSARQLPLALRQAIAARAEALADPAFTRAA